MAKPAQVEGSSHKPPHAITLSGDMHTPSLSAGTELGNVAGSHIIGSTDL